MSYLPLTAALLDPLSADHRAFLTNLHAQAAKSGIDYASLGQGWDHPTARVAYRSAQGDSFRRSQKRQQASHTHLEGVAKSLGGKSAEEAAQALIAAFCVEIGAPALAPNATWEGVKAAVDGELLNPLRSLIEGIESMTRTFNGEPVPRGPIQAAVDALTNAVLSNRYSDWRYTNPVGMRQLEGLSEAQITKWREPTRRIHSNEVTTHETEPGELGLFWATKIGGPSHGFDVEGQCLLPLLCNARGKVILVSDTAWPHHPAGRAHFRLLWVHKASPPRAILWLETVNCDFEASRAVRQNGWQEGVLIHAIEKASAMGVGLSVESHLKGTLEKLAGGMGSVTTVTDKLDLRPSNGVVEASDYLTNKHDWIQMRDEVTPPLRRAVFTPSGAKSEL